jgi:glycosyltransferase involved in cell wall biosynthesis
MSAVRSRVVLLYDRAHPDLGGMERMIAEVADVLSRTHDVVVVAERRNGRLAREQVEGINVVRHRSWEHRDMRQTFAGSSLVLGFGYTPYSFRAVFTLAAGGQALKAGVPLAWCPTYYPIPRTKGSRSPHFPLSLLKAVRRMCRVTLDRKYHTLFEQCQIVFALTEQERLYWKELFRGVPVKGVSHGVSGRHARCTHRALARASLEERYGPGPHLLTIGRITPQKNQEVVVRALAFLKGRVPAVHLLVVGPPEGPEAARLRKLAAAPECRGVVTFTGPVSEAGLCQLYAGATCVVHPSRYEASGLVPLEALAHGTPVIHSGCGALQRYVALPGARSVSAADEPGAWACVIEDTLADLSHWDRQAALGRGAVLAEHTWERMASAIGRFADHGPNTVDATGDMAGLAEPALHGARSSQ